MTGDAPSSGRITSSQEEPAHVEQYVKPPSEAVRCDSCAVLVIDDDASFSHLVSSILRKAGFTVRTASSGAKGLNMLSSEPRDVRVVLLDYTMPDLNGDETLQHLRKLDPSIKVVAVTSSIPQAVKASFRDGVDRYIEKPIYAEELIDAIVSLVGSNPH